jgi:hypothetical protein
MGAASNTVECVLEHRGKVIAGVMMGQLPLGRADLASGTVTIIFTDGSGFTFRGSFWSETKDDVSRALGRFREQMEAAGLFAAEALRLAGMAAQPEGEPCKSR